jgi:methylated-DNA-[protein]-cysteine S-methyltransferase
MKKNELVKAAHHVRQTPFGPIAILWSIHEGQPKIFRIALLNPKTRANHLSHTSFGSSKTDTCPEIYTVGDLIEAFLHGEDVHFPLEIVRMDICSDFQRNVLLAEYGIPRGQVGTYRLIAAFLGHPSAARAVGTALAKNPFPIIIPCHRAVRSDRTLGGYQGGFIMKKALLEMEGIRLDHTGRVIVHDFYYRPPFSPTLDNKIQPIANRAGNSGR